MSSSAELMRVEIDTAFLISGPVSRISECIGFCCADVESSMVVVVVWWVLSRVVHCVSTFLIGFSCVVLTSSVFETENVKL